MITSNILDDFEGSERDERDPVADLPVKPDVGPKFDLMDPYPEFDLIDPDFDLFCPGAKFDLKCPEFDPAPVSGLPRICLLGPPGPALPGLLELHVALVVDPLFWLPLD